MRKLKVAFSTKSPPSNVEQQYGYVSMERKGGNGWEPHQHQEAVAMPSAGPNSYPPYPSYPPYTQK